MKISNMTQFKAINFTTRQGKHVETRPHFAAFDDKHNSSKSRVIIVLYHRKYKAQNNTGLGVGDLHKQSGVNYDYIKSRVTKWVDWGYLERSVKDNKIGRPLYVYTLAERGRHFIEDIIPKDWLKRYISEIKAFKANHKDLMKVGEC